MDIIKFDQLEVLDLSDNKITDINALKKVNLKMLKKLVLTNNDIKDIKALDRKSKI